MSETVSGQVVTLISGQIVTPLDDAPQSLFSWVNFKMTFKWKTKDGISDNLLPDYTSDCNSASSKHKKI